MGHEENDASDACSPCEIGYYKDNEVPGVPCEQCPLGKATGNIGSTAPADCTHGESMCQNNV